MMYRLEDIVHVHLEVSSLCNAACPLCPRNFFGHEYNSGYTERNLTLEEVKKIFPESFVKQLKRMIINGNFGDAVMNPETTDICRYFKELNPQLHINLSTNGGARSAKFWQELAMIGVEVTFCLDGIDNDTHKIYRRNTLYTTVIKNAQTFIAVGGRALWKMIKFEHNSDQISTARQLSKDMGFAAFLLVDDGRDSGPVYNNNGELEFIIGPSKIGYTPMPYNVAIDGHTNPARKINRLQTADNVIPIKKINCEVARDLSLYVDSTGDIYPCCYVGLSPKTFRNNSDVSDELEQIAKIIKKNNALQYSLAECIEWFDAIEQSWSKQSFSEGRLMVCNRSCGSDSDIDYTRNQFHVKDSTYTDH